LQGVVFVGSAEEEVAVIVEFIVPLTEVVVRGRPVRTIWEDVVEVSMLETLPAIFPIPYIVVDPSVVVIVVDPLVTVETMADVLIADELVGIVTVDA
jgi:hypothetical protein